MRYRIRQTQDRWTAGLMDRVCFPDDETETFEGSELWFVVNDEHNPVAYAAGNVYRPDKALYLNRAGVLPEARGSGLQRRLVRARVAWAKGRGLRMVYTYTVPSNIHSINNLIACGFNAFQPSVPWNGPGFCYWIREI